MLDIFYKYTNKNGDFPMKKMIIAICSALTAGLFAAEQYNFKKVFTHGICDSSGTAINIDKLKGKTVLIYYSASWCGPCRAFTPKLVEF